MRILAMNLQYHATEARMAKKQKRMKQRVNAHEAQIFKSFNVDKKRKSNKYTNIHLYMKYMKYKYNLG